MNSLRIAFFGTPDFAVATLDKLVKANMNIVAVYTAPDKPSGRGQQLAISDVKKYALEHNLSVFQPEKLKNPDFVVSYQEMNIDLAIVVAYRMMPEIIWKEPKYGTINLHGSLLPQYRGAAPINWALINGEKETGVTTFFINSEIDKGDILFQSRLEILPEDDFGSLYRKLKHLGADLVLETVAQLTHGEIHAIKQDFSGINSPAPKIDKELLEIRDFNSCIAIHNLVRGLIPVYKPFFIYKDKKYIIKEGHYHLQPTGHIESPFWSDQKSFIRLACLDGYYEITQIQLEGKKAMDIRSFFNGNSF